MLTIAFFVSAVFIYYIFKLFVNKDKEKNINNMEQEEQRHSSSESDNFENIDSEDITADGACPPGDARFIVGDEEVQDEGPSHEGRDSFPNAPPPNLKPKLTVAQQLALAEKRSKLRLIVNLLDAYFKFQP
nr:uncharacterized protein LOC116776515 [Danaus plexippus plexippus]